MPEKISTYWAKNVKLKSFQGDKFEFVLNIKNSDGSKYVFPANTQAFFGVYKRTPNPQGSVLTNFSGFITSFNAVVGDGTITITSGDEEGYFPVRGTYHYVLYTFDGEEYSINLQDIQDQFSVENNQPFNFLRVGWLGNEQSAIAQSLDFIEAEEGQYYHEWYTLDGDADLQPYEIIEDYKTLEANVEEGPNLYFSSATNINITYGIFSPYAYLDHIDNEDVWSNNTLTYQEGMTEISIRTILQTKNVVKYDFDGPPNVVTEHVINFHTIPTLSRFSVNTDEVPGDGGSIYNLKRAFKQPFIGGTPELSLEDGEVQATYPEPGGTYTDIYGEEQEYPFKTPQYVMRCKYVSWPFVQTGDIPLEGTTGGYNIGDMPLQQQLYTNLTPAFNTLPIEALYQVYERPNSQIPLNHPGYNFHNEEQRAAMVENWQNIFPTKNFTDEFMWTGLLPNIYSNSSGFEGQPVSSSQDIFRGYYYYYPYYNEGDGDTEFNNTNGATYQDWNDWGFGYLASLPEFPLDYVESLQALFESEPGSHRLAFDRIDNFQNNGTISNQQNRPYTYNSTQPSLIGALVNFMPYDSESLDDFNKMTIDYQYYDDSGEPISSVKQGSRDVTGSTFYESYPGKNQTNFSLGAGSTGNGYGGFSIQTGITDVFYESYYYNPTGPYELRFAIGNLKPCVDKSLGFVPGDTNNDGIVNIQDLNAIIGSFTLYGEDLPGDLNDDGYVGVADLNLVLGNWLGTIENPAFPNPPQNLWTQEQIDYTLAIGAGISGSMWQTHPAIGGDYVGPDGYVGQDFLSGYDEYYPGIFHFLGFAFPTNMNRTETTAVYHCLTTEQRVVDETYFADLTELPFRFRILRNGNTAATWQQTIDMGEDGYEGLKSGVINSKISIESGNSTPSGFNANLNADNLDDGDEIEIQIKPLNYRKWLNENEGWIRITGTYIDMAWENNSYISNDNTIPVSANYWLYGDFVVNKNNTLQ